MNFKRLTSQSAEPRTFTPLSPKRIRYGVEHTRMDDQALPHINSYEDHGYQRETTISTLPFVNNSELSSNRNKTLGMVASFITPVQVICESFFLPIDRKNIYEGDIMSQRNLEVIRKRKALIQMHFGNYREFSKETGLSIATISDTVRGYRQPDAAERAYWAKKLKTSASELWN